MTDAKPELCRKFAAWPEESQEDAEATELRQILMKKVAVEPVFVRREPLDGRTEITPQDLISTATPSSSFSEEYLLYGHLALTQKLDKGTEHPQTLVSNGTNLQS